MRKPQKEILITGFVAGAAYMPVTLQMMLGSGFLDQAAQMIAFYFFPVCWAFLGLGLILPRKYFGRLYSDRQFPAVCAGVLFIFLACSLLMPVHADSHAELTQRLFVCWIPAAALYFLLGQELGSGLNDAGAGVHFQYGFFLLAMVAGGIFSDQGVPRLGGDGVFVFLALAVLSTYLGPKWLLPAAAGTGAVIVATNLDLRIERLRRVNFYAAYNDISLEDQPKKSSRDHLQNYAESFDRLAWNRRGMTFMYRNEALGSQLGVINLQGEHQLPFRSENEGHQVAHALLKKDQDILLIGVGSGRSVWAMPPEMTGKNIFAVERDANTVRLMSENGLNPNLERINYVAGDGRGFVEHSAKKWDWIILESAVQQRNVSPFQLFQPYNLYTAEALDVYWAHLKIGGTLVVEINKPGEPPRRTLAARVLRSMREISQSGAQTLHVLKNPVTDKNSGPLLMFARRGGEPLTRATLQIPADAKTIVPEDFPSRSCTHGFADASPFLDWKCMPHASDRAFTFYTCWLLALLAAVFAVHDRLFEARAPDLTALKLIFAVQSVAHGFLFLAAAYLLRSSFQDEIGSFYVFMFATTLTAAASSFFVDRRLRAGLRIPAGATAAAMVFGLAWLWVFLSMDISSYPSAAARFALLVAAIAPFYFCSSLMFHINLQRALSVTDGVRKALLFDSVALLPAYLLTPWLLFERGIPSLFGAAALLYAVMLALVWRQNGYAAATQSAIN